MKLKDRINLAWRVLRYKPSNLYHHALRELPPSDDEMQTAMNRDLLDIIAVFCTQGHSGFSAGYAVRALEKLLSFKPLGPLTGADSEWVEVGENLWQNNRCGRVFKEADGRAYDSQGRIFREPDGSCWQNGESRVYITFPYTPTTEYVDRLAT